MRIFLTWEYSFQKKGFGGGAPIILGIAEQLLNLGNEISLITSGIDEIGASTKFPGLKFYTTYFSINRYVINPIFVGLYSAILIIVKRPQLVISFTGESFLLSLLCRTIGIRFCVYLAAPELPRFNNYKNIKLNFSLYLQYLAAKKCKRIFVLSRYLSNQAIINWSIDKRRIVFIGCGIDREYLRSSYILKESADTKKVFKIISIGRIAFKQKPLDILAHSIAELKDYIYSWTIIGSGQDLMALKELIINLGIQEKVIFFESYSANEIKKQISAADIVFLPSNYESLMLTAYESISQNKITIVNNVADLKKDFDQFPSVIITSDSTKIAYSQSIKYAMENFKILSAQCAYSSNYVIKKMNWDNCGEILKKELLSMIEITSYNL